MIRSLIFAGALALFSAFTCAAQSAGSGASAPSEPSKPSAQSQSSAPAAPQTQTPAAAANAAAPKDQGSDKDQTEKKPKKVWTNEEMSAVHGNISVVGDPVQASSNSDSRQANTGSDSGSRSYLELV